MVTTVLWRRLDIPGMDRCLVEPVPEGFRIAGTALMALDDAPCEIRYTVLTDPQWRTRTVGVHVSGLEADRRLALTADGAGGWSVSDTPLLELYGALDVDFAWTPATNTLPVMRLGLEIGATAEITVAMIEFPGHSVRRVTQRYTRTGEATYRFASGDFGAEIVIGDAGLVTDYEGLWSSLAWSGLA